MNNCPLAFGICDRICRNYLEEGCGYYFPPMPWSEILTLEERLERIEAQSIPIPYQKPKHLSWKQWDEINQLKGRTAHLENKVMEMRVAKRKHKY